MKQKKRRVNRELRTFEGLTWKILNVPILDLRNGAEEDEELDSITVPESADQSLRLKYLSASAAFYNLYNSVRVSETLFGFTAYGLVNGIVCKTEMGFAYSKQKS